MPVPNIEEFARQMQGITLVTTHNQQRANRMAKPQKGGEPAPDLRIEEPHTPPVRELRPEQPAKAEAPAALSQPAEPAVPAREQETPQAATLPPRERRLFDRRMLRRAVILSEIIGPPKSRRIR